MLLAIETSSLVSSVALLHEQTLRAELTIQARLTHSEQLMPHIADMLEKASVPKTAIDAVAVSIGPGSFTGLRIGMASAKGLSFGWNVPLIGIETPTALAWNFIGAKDPVCVLIDAQKGNVYMSLYEWQGMHLQELEPVQVAPLTEVLAQLATLGKAVVFCGDGSLLGRTQIEAASPQFRLAPPTMVIPRAGSLALAADERYSRQDVDDCMTLTPAYKRRSEAEVLWGKETWQGLMSMIVRPATPEDAQGIYEVETESFSVPWRRETIDRELANTEVTRYYVLVRPDGRIEGYAGLWRVVDEGQVTNIALRKEVRRQGYGELLVRVMMEAAYEEGCTDIFLEVRFSNLPALSLYRKLGYEVLSIRKKYYSDPEEDAYVMDCKKEKYHWVVK